MTDGLTFPKVDFCPNCGNSVQEHPLDAAHEKGLKQLGRYSTCPLYRQHVRRSIAVTAALLFREANK